MSMTHEITEGLPRNKRPRRKGRGESSGHGKTSGRGNKGSKARNGKYIKRGYEGGQTPIFRRFPKRGFSNENFERRFYIVNIADLERFDSDTTVDAAVLIDAGLVPDEKLPIKILGEGPFTKKLTVAAAWYSKSAHQKIGEAGGAANNLSGAAFEFSKPKKIFVKRDKQAKAAEGESAAPAPAPAAAAPAAPVEEEKPAAGE